jgi:adenosylcobyric acid synthase
MVCFKDALTVSLYQYDAPREEYCMIPDFNPVNPIGMPPWTRVIINRNIEKLRQRPGPEYEHLVWTIGKRFGVEGKRIMCSSSILEAFSDIVTRNEITNLLIVGRFNEEHLSFGEKIKLVPTYIPYSVRNAGAFPKAKIQEVISSQSQRSLVYIDQPHPVTGKLNEHKTITDLIAKYPDHIFCVNETYALFCKEYRTIAAEPLPNLVTLHSIAPYTGTPGLQLVWTISEEEDSNYDTVDSTFLEHIPRGINQLEIALTIKALKDELYLDATTQLIETELSFLRNALGRYPAITCYDTDTIFFLCKTDPEIMGNIEQEMSRSPCNPLLNRITTMKGSESFFQLAVQNRDENQTCLDLITDVVERFQKRPQKGGGETVRGGAGKARKPKPPAVMFQGTSSNAGKSVLAAAFCRILLQDGYRPAPFKAQNMALNSFVTAEGGEMGRAQVVQAQACRIPPDVRMNPVLLKPSSDVGSQVILEGKPIGTMQARNYYDYKSKLWNTVTGNYDALAREYDVLVLEGAGSPGEVNLKAHDIVNMRMAKYAEAQVLLVGDIDRGGVFASFIGTLDVMEEWERELILGFLVNKFRGDASLLGPAFDYVEEFTGKGVLGTVPYLQDLKIPEEDSVTFKEQLRGSQGKAKPGVLSIVAIDLPHISNFTDLDPLRMEPDVDLQVVRTREDAERISSPDVIIIPGSKNVIGDLYRIDAAGLTGYIRRCTEEKGTEIVGICGGFQMLGRVIEDPHKLESVTARIDGIGLLDIETVLEEQKILRQTESIHTESGHSVKGYEIHHGKTTTGSCTPILTKKNGEITGIAHAKLPVWGTYLHGIFDSDVFRHWFLESIRKKKGLPALKRRHLYDLEAAFDTLADAVRGSVDVEGITRSMGL